MMWPRGRSAFLAATAFAQTILAAANAAAARTLLGVPATPHGASDHTDRTRSIWIPAEEFYTDFGSPTQALAGSSGFGTEVQTWQLPASATTLLSGAARVMPADYVSGAVTVTAYWAPSTTNTGNASLQGFFRSIASGGSIAATTATATPTRVIAAGGTAHGLMKTVLSSSGQFTPTAGDPFAIGFGRVAASDTFTGVVEFIGLLIEYTADQ